MPLKRGNSEVMRGNNNNKQPDKKVTKLKNQLNLLFNFFFVANQSQFPKFITYAKKIFSMKSTKIQSRIEKLAKKGENKTKKNCLVFYCK